MDRYRCKLAGHPDTAFVKSNAGNDEEEVAVSWLEAFHVAYPETAELELGKSYRVVVETNGESKCVVTLKVTKMLFPTKTELL